MSESRTEGRLDAGILLALAVVVVWDSVGYPTSLTSGVPGPAFFPRVLAALLIACAALLIGRRPRTIVPKEPASAVRTEEALSDTTAWVRLGMATLVIIGFLLLAPRLGTVTALPLLVGLLMWLVGERSRVALTLIPLAFAGFVFLVFSIALRVPLPAGVLP